MTASPFSLSRRSLLQAAGAGLAGMAVGGPALAAGLPGPSPIDVGEVKDGKVKFPNWKGDSDKPSPPPPAPLPDAEKIGWAIVGLGRLSLEEILPAFGESLRSKPVALVSGSPEKAAVVAKQYDIADQAIYSYADFDKIADNKDIQAVYIVLPNGMHKEFVLRAAKASKHILCEKPMAVSSAEAKEMIAACDKAGVKLMVAYRCQYEPYNRYVRDIVRSGKQGKVRFIEAVNTQMQGKPNQWRLKKAQAGGGALPDIGIYCLNGVRFMTGEEPVEVYAQLRKGEGERFREAEEGVSFMLRFPSGIIANCATDYDAHDTKDMRLTLQNATLHFDKAFAYTGQQLRISHRQDDHEVVEQVQLGAKNQFALEMDHFSRCIAENIRPHTPGEEGLQDHLLMEAIYKSAETGQPVKLAVSNGLDVTRGPEPKKD